MRGNTLYIVVPCYNEEEVLPETARRLGDKLKSLMNAGKISPRSRVLFVNDGSKDGTWAVISTGRTPCCAGWTCPGTGGTRTPCWRGS